MIDDKNIKNSKLGRCSYCNKVLTFLPHTCQYCGKKFCRKHRLPENHSCEGNPQPPPPPKTS